MNREIRYGGSTQYITSFNNAKSEWNALGYVDILPDNWWAWQSLTLEDYNNVNNDDTAAYWYYDYWSTYVKFNKHVMNQANNVQKKWITAHEIGHSLGLLHSPHYWDLVYHEYSVNYISSHDESDYNYLWGPNGVGND